MPGGEEPEDGRVSQASSWGNMTLPMPDEEQQNHDNEEVRRINAAADTPTPQEVGLSTKKCLFPVQRVAVIMASRAAAIFFFFFHLFFWGG